MRSGRSAYPGEWAFVLGAKLASAAVPMRQGRRRRADAEADKWKLFAEGLTAEIQDDGRKPFSGVAHLHLTVGMPSQTITAASGPTPTGEERDEDEDGTSVATGSTIDDSDDSSLSSDDGDDDGDSEDSNDEVEGENRVNEKDTVNVGAKPTNGKLNSGGNLIIIDGDSNSTTNGTFPDAAKSRQSIDNDGKMDGGAVAGAVIGALLGIALIALIFVFRRRLRDRFNRWRYKQMPDAPTPPPGSYGARYISDEKSVSGRTAASHVGPTSTLFGFDKYQASEPDAGPRFPVTAMIRNSVTTSRRESRKAKYVRTSLLRARGGNAPSIISEGQGMPEGFYAVNDYPPEKPMSRQLSDRFPIAVPPAAVRQSTVSDNPTLADGIIKTLAKTRPEDFPYPLPLIPPTPVQPVDSHFSWSTNPSLPDISAARSVAHASISTEGEPRFRGVHSWVNNQSKRLERQERLQERIRESSNGGSPRLKSPRGSGLSLPDTPAEFRQHPGRPVEFGKHERLMSADLDLEMGEDRK